MRKLAVQLLVGSLAVGACRDRAEPQPPVDRSAFATPAPAPAAPELSKIRRIAERDGRLVREIFERLEGASRAKDAASARLAYLELRRAWRRLLPLAAMLTYAGTLEPESDEADEVPEDLGLRPIAGALATDPPKWEVLAQSLHRTGPASKLAPNEPRTISLSLPKLAHSLTQAVFHWGVLLDGSGAESSEESRIDAIDGGRALLEYTDEVRALTGGSKRLSNAVARFDAWLAAREKEGRIAEKLDGLMASGELGAALRLEFAQKGAVVLPAFAPRRPTEAALFAEPVSPATFPRLPGAAPDERQAALGKRLFGDARLSKDRTLSCASCHRESAALSSGPTRPRRFDGKSVVRDVPTLFNVAYEPMLFWDGRASTLTRQTELAVEQDMGGDWAVIVDRLRDDAEVTAALPGGVTKEAITRALAAHQRTLQSDDAPFDRYVRGDRAALGASELRGFDIFYGEARCSRCHRLPLTSGAAPPRFTKAEVAVIGVPKRPGTRELDPDLGRGGLETQTTGRHAFKVPSLRNLPRTAPYFHNGAFRTLEEVVDFYAAGAGEGLGIAPPNFDPDVRAFALSKADRRALLSFLSRGLNDANAR